MGGWGGVVVFVVCVGRGDVFFFFSLVGGEGGGWGVAGGGGGGRWGGVGVGGGGKGGWRGGGYGGGGGRLWVFYLAVVRFWSPPARVFLAPGGFWIGCWGAEPQSQGGFFIFFGHKAQRGLH